MPICSQSGRTSNHSREPAASPPLQVCNAGNILGEALSPVGHCECDRWQLGWCCDGGMQQSDRVPALKQTDMSTYSPYGEPRGNRRRRYAAVMASYRGDSWDRDSLPGLSFRPCVGNWSRQASACRLYSSMSRHWF